MAIEGTLEIPLPLGYNHRMPTVVSRSRHPVFHFPEVRVVEASAGSGKTYALAKRYLQLLLNPRLSSEAVPIRQILAVTFTNKAAFEMKTRILDFLKKIALGRMPEGELQAILEPLGLSETEARQRAFSLMEELIRHYNYFQVQTIDKFINALLSGCAFKIGLTANFRIRTNSREYLEYALDRLIDSSRSRKDVQKHFEEFLHNYLYLENRSGWFPKKDMLHIMTALYAQRNHYGLTFVESGLKVEGLIKDKRIVMEELRILHAELPQGTHSKFVSGLTDFLEKHDDIFDIDKLSGFLAREDFPVRKGIEVPDDVRKRWDKIRRKITGVCEQEAWSLFDPYIRIFGLVEEFFREAAARDDVLFLEELNKRAGLLFDEERVTVEELYYRLAARFRHYLIDEFQDTSRLQWNNLRMMAEEALSTGGTLFYVGDRKQAIYGFRGGDARLFDEVKTEFTSFNVADEQLSINWRSRRQIVEFNNAIFSVDNLRRFMDILSADEKSAVVFGDDDIAWAENIFGHSHQTPRAERDGGLVRMVEVDVAIKNERDTVIRDAILKLMGSLQGRFRNSEIALLTRSNSDVEQLTRWLLEAGIQVESERTSDIRENRRIRELVAFLKFLNSPIDNLAFSEFILGDIFTRAADVTVEDMQHFMFSLRTRMETENNFYIYTAFRERFPRLWETYIDEFFRNVGLYPLYELIVTIFSRLKVLESFPGDQGFFMHFLELIKKREEDYTDSASFLEEFEILEGGDLYVKITDTDAVKILTVHKAKGLEFPVVILPFLCMTVKVGSDSADNKQSYVLREQGNGMELVRLKSKYRNFSQRLDAIYIEEYKKAFMAELNSIYVGLTRARDELYAFIPAKAGNGRNLVKDLIPMEWREQGCEVERKSQAVSTDGGPVLLPAGRYGDWIQFLSEEFIRLPELINRQKRREGEILHFMLSQVGHVPTGRLDSLLETIAAKTCREFPDCREIKKFLMRVRELLTKEPLKPFFDTPEGEILTEFEIVNPHGHLKRIDRLIVKPDEVWIADYKSSVDYSTSQRDQVREYLTIVKTLYPGRKVRGFLIYLDTLTIEQVDE